MTTYFTDPFTGTNGSAWNASNWTSLFAATGSSATIQGNKGRQVAGSSSGSNNKKGMRYTSTLTDVEIAGTLSFTTSASGSVEIWLRASTSAPDGTGYFLQFDGPGGGINLLKAVSFSYTNLSSNLGGITLASGTTYGFKFYVVGTTVKAKVWTGSEPGSYTVSTTDSAVGAAGYAYIATLNNAAANVTVDYDDVVLTDGTGNAFTYTASVTGAGVLAKAMTKNAFTGSSTGAGALTTRKVVVRAFTASVSTVGVFAKQAIKLFTGSSTITGLSKKTMFRVFTASSTATGFFRKAGVRLLTGSVTATGVSSRTFLGRVFGRPGKAVVTAWRAAEIKIRVRRS